MTARDWRQRRERGREREGRGRLNRLVLKLCRVSPPITGHGPLKGPGARPEADLTTGATASVPAVNWRCF